MENEERWLCIRNFIKNRQKGVISKYSIWNKFTDVEIIIMENVPAKFMLDIF